MNYSNNGNNNSGNLRNNYGRSRGRVMVVVEVEHPRDNVPFVIGWIILLNIVISSTSFLSYISPVIIITNLLILSTLVMN